MNKRAAMSTAMKALFTIIIVVILITAIIIFKDQIAESGGPLYEDFLEGIQVAKDTAEEPDTQEEIQFNASLGVFWSDFEECKEFSGEMCGCDIRALPIPEGGYILVVNKGNSFGMTAIKSDNTYVEGGQLQETGNIGLVYRDIEGDLGCIFPETFTIIQKDAFGETLQKVAYLYAESAASTWGVVWQDPRVQDGDTYYSLALKQSASVHEGLIPTSFIYGPDMEPLSTASSFSYANYNYNIYYKYNSEEQTWEVKSKKDTYTPVDEFSLPNKLYQQNELLEILEGRDKESGLDRFASLKTYYDGLESDPSQYNSFYYPEMYKASGDKYCLVTDLITLPIEITGSDNTHSIDTIPFNSNIFHPILEFIYMDQQYCKDL